MNVPFRISQHAVEFIGARPPGSDNDHRRASSLCQITGTRRLACFH